MLKKDFPRLYAEFGPTESQIRNHQNNRGKNEEAEAAAEAKPDQQTIGKSHMLGFGFCDTNIDSPDKESNASSAFVVGEKNMEVQRDEKLNLNSSGSEQSTEKQRVSDCSQPESIDANSGDDQEESKQEMEAIDQLLNVSMVVTEKVGIDFESTEPRKSIMKKPGTPVPGVLGKRTHAQTLQSMIHNSNKEDEPLQSNQ